MYKSVSDLLCDRDPELVKMLDNSGGFWPGIKNNLTTNADLEKTIVVANLTGDFDSSCYQAALVLLRARINGDIASPATVTA